MLDLYKHECILFGEFKLTSGLTSPYYIDLRITPSFPQLFKKIINVYKEHVSPLKPEVIAGIATAGLPLASVLAYEMSLPLVYVRKEERKHGTKKLVEGSVKPGAHTIIVDDVATTGGSIVRAVRELRNIGLNVKYAVVLVDREQGAVEKLKELNVELKPILKVSDLIRILYEEKVIDSSIYNRVTEYIRRWKTSGI
mgnify:CR=1 FL=1